MAIFAKYRNVQIFRSQLLQWLKDGYRIASTTSGVLSPISSGFQLSEDGRYLNVQAADLQHTGDYTCRAVNQAGEDSKQYQVNVRGRSNQLPML